MNSGAVHAPCQSIMLDIVPLSSTYMLPEWKSGCQKRGEERSGSLGMMLGMAGMYLRSDDTWASREFCVSDVYCHGFWVVLLGTACLLIQSISRLAMDSRYCPADFPIPNHYVNNVVRLLGERTWTVVMVHIASFSCPELPSDNRSDGEA